MKEYLLYTLLLALSGVELFFLLRRSHTWNDEEQRLSEAAEYTIIDATPPAEKL